MISRLNDVLNISGEPCSYLSEQRVHQLLTRAPAGYYQSVRSMFTRIATGKAVMELPDKLLFRDGADEGDFRVMPCVVRDADSVWKTVKLVGTNRLQLQVPGQITVGKAFALDPRENFITHIFEACLLSSARTAVCAVMAIDMLLPDFPKRISIVGAGRIGYYAALFSAVVGGVEKISISDINPERAASCAAMLRESVGGAEFTAAPSPDGSAEALLLCTTSRTPFCSPADTRARIVVSVGADTDDQHELDCSWTGRARLFVDTMDSLHFGDLALWLSSGLIAEESVSDLFSAARGECAASRDQMVFVSTGSALFDNLTIAYMLSVEENE